jgi:sugar lactone lactonase YvrE
MPHGTVEVLGHGLGATDSIVPTASIQGLAADVLLSQPGRVILQVPEEAASGPVVVHRQGAESNAVQLRVATLIAENLNPVSNPAIDAAGNVYATFSGPRGQSVPISVIRIDQNQEMKPFARGIMNATGLAFDRKGNLYVSSRHEGTVYRVSPDGATSVYAEGMGVATGIAFDSNGNLYVSSRHEGTVYRVSPDGATSVYAEGMGVATGIAFDSNGNLYVGDRSGTIFKIAQEDRQIFVFATLEPSVAAYHLAFADDDTLYVTGPTISGHDAINAIDLAGTPRVFYRGLGRPQGLAVAANGDVYVAASLHGRRGIVRVASNGKAEIAASGSGLVGLALRPDGDAVLATNDAVYHLELGVKGRRLA